MADLAVRVARAAVVAARLFAKTLRIGSRVAAATTACASLALLLDAAGLAELDVLLPSAKAQLSQTISFNALANKTYGAPPFAVSATASSGLTVSFASLTTPVCTVSGTAVTIIAVGTCTIQASQAGNATYAPAPSVNQSFTVAKASQTITFNALAGKTYGNPPFTVSATASSGLAVTFSSLTTTVCTVSGSTVTIKSGGTCTIQASQAGNGNYNAAPNVSQSFIVNPASQTITFPALAQQSVGSSSTLSATASSGLTVTFASLSASVCTVSGTTLTPLAVGTCVIQASQAGNANYAAAPSLSQRVAVISGAAFAPQSSYVTGLDASRVAVGDFNGDGMLDVAVSNLGDFTVSVFIGNGDGTLTLAATLPTEVYPDPIAVGDFNGDGKLDLVVGNRWNETLSVYFGNGNGAFSAPRTIAVAGTPYDIAVADLNHDGRLDLVVTDGSGATAGQTIEVLLGKGDGSFQAPIIYAVGANPQAIAVGDFNADGKLDLAVANYDGNNLAILLGRGDGTFVPVVGVATGTGPRSLVMADFNGDGKLDLATANNLSGDVSILLGRGDGTFTLARNIWTGSPATFLGVGDFNGDGKQDLAVTQVWTDNVGILLGVGDGTFRSAISFATGVSPLGVAVGDLNRDGKPDLIVANGDSNGISVLLNTAGFTPVATLAVQAGSPQSAAINTAYALPLSVIARDKAGNPVPGATVTFSAPSTGASGTFGAGGAIVQVNTNASGIATSPVFIANGLSGSFAVVAVAGTGSATFNLTNTGGGSQAPTFTSGTAPNGIVSTPYSFTLTANGNPAPTFSVSSNALPPGLALNAISGLINGTPNTIGTYAGIFTAANGVSPNANQTFAITIAGIAQSISFGALADKVYGTAPFSVSATASSGLPVSFASLAALVCTVTGSTVTIVAPGTCTIRASQAGNATYAPALSVSQSFTVTRASQIITFDPVGSKVLGMPPFFPNATSSSGLLVYFSSLTTAVCTVTNSTVTLVATGTCTIRASQPGSTYYLAAASVDQTFTVSANQLPTVALVLPVNNSSFVAPAIIPLLATASDPEGAIAKVEFYNGSALVGSATTPPYTFSWSNVVVGSYALTAKVYDNAGGTSTSAVVNVTVNALGSSLGLVHTADFMLGNWPTGLVLADFNGDGKLDIVAPLYNGGSILLGDGTGAFQLRKQVGLSGAAMVNADFNGDGIQDIAIAWGSNISITLGNGDGTFRSAGSYPVGDSYAQWSAVVGDFNGDGKLDIVTTNDQAGTVSILLGNGDGSFRAAVAVPAGTWPSSLSVGDFNGDGKADIVALNRTGNSGTDAFTVLLSNGDGTFRAPITTRTRTGVARIAAGDFDKDGKLDLAITDPFGSVAILLGKGDGSFLPAFEYPSGAFAEGIVVSDFNGDGKLDIATANYNDNTVSILLGNGNGSFRAPFNVGVGTGPMHIVVGDLNGDGLPDLVVDNVGDASVSVFINTTGKTTRAPAFTSAPLPSGDVLTPYSYTVTASGLPPPSFAVTAGALPPGLILQPTGLITGYLPPPGMTYTGSITAHNGVAPDATQSFSISSTAHPQTITFDPIVLTILPPTVAATATSGYPVTLTSLTPGSCQLTGSTSGSRINFLVAAGTCSIRAAQGGGGAYLPAPNVDQTFAFDLNPPLVSLSSPANNANFGAPANVTLTATLGSTLLTGLVNRVDFYAGTALVGTATARPYTVAWPNVGAGTYTLTAKVTTNYLGGTSTSAPITVIVSSTAPPSVSLTAPSNNATYAAPARISVTATATSNVSGGSIRKVDFYAGNTLLNTDNNAPYSFNWNNVSPGAYTLTAKATDNLGVSATSAPVTVIVMAALAAPTVVLKVPVFGSEFALGQGITFSAEGSTPGRTIARVEFYADGVLLGSVPVTGGFASTTANFIWSGAALGTHNLSAKVVATDATSAVSSPVNVTVSDLATLLAEPRPGQVYLSPADVRMAAIPSETAGTIAKVDFYFDGVIAGSSFAPPYTMLVPVIAGSHTVFAVAQDAAGLRVPSGTVQIQVVAAPTLQVSPDINGSTVGDDNISITGVVQAPANAAIVVNGRAASLDSNGAFFINNVPLQPGSNTLTLQLNSEDVNPVAQTITVQSTGTAPFEVSLDKQEGLAPLDVELTIANRGNVPFQRIEIETGNGTGATIGDATTPTILTTLPDNRIVESVNYPVPGTYTIRVRVFDANNQVIYSAQRKVRAYGADEVGYKIVGVYNNLITRLGNNDPTSALRMFTGNAAARYASVFSALGSSLPSVAQQLGKPINGAGGEDWAELTILRSTSNGDQAFMMYIIRGEDGIWRIDSM